MRRAGIGAKRSDISTGGVRAIRSREPEFRNCNWRREHSDLIGIEEFLMRDKQYNPSKIKIKTNKRVSKFTIIYERGTSYFEIVVFVYEYFIFKLKKQHLWERYILLKEELTRVRLDKCLPFMTDQMEEPTLAAGRFIDSFRSSILL